MTGTVKGWAVTLAKKTDLKFENLLQVLTSFDFARHFAEGYVQGRDSGFVKKQDSAALIVWESPTEVLRVDEEQRYAERTKTSVLPES